MKVLLQNLQTNLFYAGPSQWVSDPLRAFDFTRIEHAEAAYSLEPVMDARIVLADPEASRSGDKLGDEVSLLVKRLLNGSLGA
jgi:hypothetical protein